MNKSLPALTIAALALAVSGCTAGDGAAADPESSSSTAAAPAPSASPTKTPVALADGFPTDRIPVMDGAEILSSTVDRSGKTITSVLVASTAVPVAEVIAYYEAALTAQGFAASPAEPGTPTSRDFLRIGAGEPETVNITVTAKDADSSTVTVGSTLLVEAEG
ncbi:hypothetical protein [Arthrobacter sp. zg-Y750]|uniref:hypothetical protein n=1 Tax=Arthrobacter sp. zg-Y750 TaxID=2894189 RepID=UPI001E331C34|nr:hypothetical protein [Arthrobacter sp. zg-Y750]MCC9178098.1 hypothetical protein [Arthrobacter sp. zg-Y750]